jgi:hypothetical protein
MAGRDSVRRMESAGTMLNRRSQSAALGRRYVVRWYRATLITAFSSFAGLLLLLLFPVENVGTVLWVAAWVPVMIVLVVRACRAAQIEFREREIVVFGLLRTRRIPLDRLRSVGVTRGSSAALLPWRVPYLELEDGSTIRVDEIRSFREPSIVDEVVAEAKRRCDC